MRKKRLEGDDCKMAESELCIQEHTHTCNQPLNEWTWESFQVKERYGVRIQERENATGDGGRISRPLADSGVSGLKSLGTRYVQ